jgi:hypothetical protein
MATWKFKNPANNYIEEVDTVTSFFGGLILGPIYFIIKGAWAAAFIAFIVGTVLVASMVGIIALPFLWLACGFMGPGIVKNNYLKRGWVDITAPSEQPQSSLSDAHRRYKELQDMKNTGKLNSAEFEEAKARLVAETGHPLNDSKPQTALQIPAAPQDLVSRLSELDSLRKSGVLTDEEFSAAKAKLIAS